MAKIVDRSEFLLLPEDIVFRKYTPSVKDDIEIKGCSIGRNDYSVQMLTSVEGQYCDTMDKADEGEEFNFDLDCQGRDGLFDDDQLYVIYSVEDIKNLIGRLSQCINN